MKLLDNPYKEEAEQVVIPLPVTWRSRQVWAAQPDRPVNLSWFHFSARSPEELVIANDFQDGLITKNHFKRSIRRLRAAQNAAPIR